MRIINYLYEKLSHMEELQEYHYAHPAKVNVLAGRVKVPVAFLITPTDWKIDIDGQVARESGKFHIYFLTTQPQLDFDALENEKLIDEMIDIALSFVQSLDKYVTILSNELSGASVYDATDRNLTGVHLTLELKENQGRCIDVPVCS